MVLSYIMLNSKGNEVPPLSHRRRRLRHPLIGPRLFHDFDDFLEPDRTLGEESELFGDYNSTNMTMGAMGPDADTFIESISYLVWFISTSFYQFIHNTVIIASLFVCDAVMQPKEDNLHQWLTFEADPAPEELNNAHLIIPQISLFFTLMAICIEGFQVISISCDLSDDDDEQTKE